MDTRKRTQSNGVRAMTGRAQHTGGAQCNNGYRTAGGPDYRSTDRQPSEHPRGRCGSERC